MKWEFFLTIVTIIGNMDTNNGNYLGFCERDMSKKFTQIDMDTGEEVGGFVAVIRPKQKSAFERHFTMNQDALKILAKTLTGEQFKVLMMLLADLDYENYIQVAQADIAESLEMQKTHVSRGVKALLDIGVLLQGPKIGRSHSYRLNPQFGWKGTVKNHKKALKHGLSVIDGGKV